jgi:hypothetical protein
MQRIISAVTFKANSTNKEGGGEKFMILYLQIYFLIENTKPAITLHIVR